MKDFSLGMDNDIEEFGDGTDEKWEKDDLLDEGDLDDDILEEREQDNY